jgi:hypothetical protein
MSNNNLFREIEILLNGIIQKNNILEQEGNNISQIDLDIIKSEIKDLYQLYYQLEVTGKMSKVIIQESINSKEEIIKNETDNKRATRSKQEKEIIIDPEEKNEIQTTIILEQKNEIKEQANATTDLFTSTETITISEKFRDNKSSINEKIGQKKPDKSIADKLKNSHINDIKSSIGINEKFQFINELFEGNMNEYNTFIAKLNNLNNLEEANSFINEQKSIKKWKDNLDSLNKLTELLENRY